MNDTDKSHLNFTRVNLEGIVFEGTDKLDVKYRLNGVLIETTLQYDSYYSARNDYEMIIEMLNSTERQREMLMEEFL